MALRLLRSPGSEGGSLGGGWWSRWRTGSYGFLSAAALALPAAKASALPDSHSPFPPREHRAASLDTCDAHAHCSEEFPPKGTVDYRHENMHLALDRLEYGYEATVLDGSTEIGSKVFIVQNVVGASDVGDTDAVCTDLNGDGPLDFAVLIWDHGDG